MVRVVGQWSGHILLCASGGNLTRAHFHRRCLAAADRPLPLPLPRCRTCSARRLAAGLSHPASGRAGMRRVGGRRRSSVSDRANASVVAAGEVTDEQAASRQVSGAGSGLVRSLPRAAASELLPRLLLCHADAPALLGSRQRALCCRPPSERLAGPLTFVTAFGLRRVPYARPGLCASRQAPPLPPRRGAFTELFGREWSARLDREARSRSISCPPRTPNTVSCP